MSILNYFTIGVMFGFLIELLLNSLSDHPQVKEMDIKWGWNERIVAIIIWPAALIIFVIHFFKSVFK